MEPTQKYEDIISTINLGEIYHAVTKKSRLGAPEELNFPAMIISVVERYVERIPTIKDLIKRLHHAVAFKLDSGFLVCDTVPLEASYSRLVTKLMECDILEKEKERIMHQAIEEGSITDDTAAVDPTHFEARDQAPPKEEKSKPKPKKRGRKTKDERDQWLKEQAEKEANMPLYEKRIEAQLDVSLTEPRSEVPTDPKWG